jgi:predicted TIM-barrel fold metal-dependent hydrolase
VEAINERHRPDPANMTRGNLPTIDVHAHALLPVWISALAKATGQTAGSVKFADAPLPDWSVEGHLRMMDEHAIGASVLSLPGATSFLRGDDAKVLARAMNEQFAEIIREHPHRFSAFAVVPMDDVEAALEETAYALDVLKLEGVSSDASSDGKYLGHAYYDPWLEELNRRRTTLFVHPGVPPRFEMTDVGLNVSILEFMFESTRMAANMVISGAKERFSKINIISTHGGGTIPYSGAAVWSGGADGRGNTKRPLFVLLRPYRHHLAPLACRAEEVHFTGPPANGFRLSDDANDDDRAGPGPIGRQW